MMSLFNTFFMDLTVKCARNQGLREMWKGWDIFKKCMLNP